MHVKLKDNLRLSLFWQGHEIADATVCFTKPVGRPSRRLELRFCPQTCGVDMPATCKKDFRASFLGHVVPLCTVHSFVKVLQLALL